MRVQANKQSPNKQSEPSERAWRKLYKDKAAFQEILGVLLAHEEKTHRRRSAPEHPSAMHLIRKALSICETNSLNVYLYHKGGFVYQVVGLLESPLARVSTVWIHEDGIRAERELYADQARHPVHRICCLTDLYENSAAVLEDDEIAFDVLPYLERVWD